VPVLDLFVDFGCWL